jgi:hypothetical protein
MDIKSPDNQEVLKPARTRKKPLLCSIILYSALTYFLILALLFLSGSIFWGKVMESIKPYFSPEETSPDNYKWFAIVGAALFSMASAGIILFILRKRIGFYIFIAAAVVIFALDFAFLNFDWMRYLILSGYIFIIGIAHFSRRCYN